MKKVWKLLHLQIEVRFLGYEIMSCLLLESIFKAKQDSNHPTYYGNNVFYKQSAWVLLSISHFCVLDMKDSLMIEGSRSVNEDSCFHLFVMSTF